MNNIIKKIQLYMECAEILLLIIGGVIGFLAFIIGIFAAIISGFTFDNIVSDVTGVVLKGIINYVAPIWLFLWIVNTIKYTK